MPMEKRKEPMHELHRETAPSRSHEPATGPQNPGTGVSHEPPKEQDGPRKEEEQRVQEPPRKADHGLKEETNRGCFSEPKVESPETGPEQKGAETVVERSSTSGTRFGTLVLHSEAGVGILAAPVGAKHIEEKKPGQDAVAALNGIYRGEPYVVFAVADGHGSKDYSRSDEGACYAVHAACLLLGDRARAIISGELTGVSDVESFWDRDFLQKVREHWRKTIEDTIARSGEKQNLKPFGTTLQMGLLLDNRFYAANLGDGSLYLVHPAEDPREDPAVETVFGEQKEAGDLSTDSLLHHDAEVRFRKACIDLNKYHRPLLAIMTTDGLTDSLQRFHEQETPRHIYRILSTEGVDAFCRRWVPALNRWSDEGVGDDMGCIVLYWPEAAMPGSRR